jgi:hypothetical protein
MEEGMNETQYCLRDDQYCKYLEVEFLSHWCKNEKCCQEPGTNLPVINCPYYRPEDTSKPWWEYLALGLLMSFYTALAILLSWSLTLCL